MVKDEFLILPGCDDTNRGDQALIWETVDIANAAGFNGHFSMIATKECGKQSKKIGIDSLAYLLPHPSMHSKGEVDNRSYRKYLKLKWALFSCLDLMTAIPLNIRFTRPIAEVFLSEEQRKTLNIYKHAKAAFVKGGGFLHDYDGLTDIYKIFYFLYHINLAHSMGIPVYVMPNSYGPFKSDLSSWMVKRCLKKCKLVCSRESISKDVLKNKCGIKSVLSRDLAMYLEKDASFDVDKCFLDNNIKMQKGKMVGITVRPYRFPGIQNADELYEKYKQSVCEYILWLIKYDYHPVMIEHVYSENFHERDLICINEIIELVKAKGQKVDVFSNLTLNCRQMKSVYAKMDYLVGTRFHSVIFSLTEKIPVIAITYGGNKGNGIMKDLGLAKYSIPIEEISSELLCSKFASLTKNNELIRRALEKAQLENKREYDKLVLKMKNAKSNV